MLRLVKGKIIDWTRFKEARERMKLSQYDVRDLTGITQARISNSESMNFDTYGDATIRLMYFYGLTADDMLIDDPNGKGQNGSKVQEVPESAERS